MTTTRFLTGLVLLAAAGPAVAQPVMPPYSPPGRSAGLVPSVLPTGGEQPEAPAPRPRPAASLEKMTMPTPPGGPEGADPAATLNGVAGPGAQPGLPTGSYASPWYTDGPGCCGPLGRDGRVGYEVYTYTGPNILWGHTDLTSHLNTGWMTGMGGRTLFFDREHEAAWLVDLGLSYTYNRGDQNQPIDLFIRQPRLTTTNPVTGAQTQREQPDQLVTSVIRGLHRTSFNFGFGRDWWLWGPGAAGFEHGWNARVGASVGGRWGTSHVDVVPLNVAQDGYARRQVVYHGVYIGAHGDFEVPMGGWIFFAGLNVQWGYDWTNVIPPANGDLQNLNILMTSGIRF